MRFGDYTAVVTAKDMGRSQAASRRTSSRSATSPSSRSRRWTRSARRLTVELSQMPAVAGRDHDHQRQERRDRRDGRRLRLQHATSSTTRRRPTARPARLQALRLHGGGRVGDDARHAVVSGAPIKRGGWTPHNYDGSTEPRRRADEDRARQVSEHPGRPPARHGRHPDRRADGAPLRHHACRWRPTCRRRWARPKCRSTEMVSAYSAFPNKGVRLEKHLIRRVARPRRQHSRRVGEDDLQGDERVRRADDGRR